MGRTSAEYGLWFAVTSLGYTSGNITAARQSQRFGIDAMIMAGVICELIGASLATMLVATTPEAGPAIIFLPQIVIFSCNGLLLPNAIAGAISIRTQAARAASGMTGFVQMAVGAVSRRRSLWRSRSAQTAMPMALDGDRRGGGGIAYAALVGR